MISSTDIMIRLVVSVILGGIVGFERQKRNKAAGLRTHILVSLGSCLLMIVSLNIALLLFYQHQIINTDAERIAAQVVSGIGFLGAGTILANQKGLTIHGLTSAANLWVVAAVGLAAGAGFWVAAVITTLLVYLTLAILSKLEFYIKTVSTKDQFIITMYNVAGQLGKITNYFGDHQINIMEIDMSESHNEEPGSGIVDILFRVELPPNITMTKIITELSTIDGVKSIKKVDHA